MHASAAGWRRGRRAGGAGLALACGLALATPAAAGPLPAARAEMLQLATGRLLVAARTLRDPNFAESVVLLLEYGRAGAMGVVVNRPLDVTLSALLPDEKAFRDVPPNVFAGGPVARDRLVFLGRAREPPDGAARVLDDVFLGADLKVLRRIVAESDVSRARLRVYVGYAGWAPGQLDAELARGDWHVSPGATSIVFATEPEGVWPRLIERHSGVWARRAVPSPARVAGALLTNKRLFW